MRRRQVNVVGVICSGCGIKLFVMFREVFARNENLWGKRVEFEVDGTKSDASFAVADRARFYTCPACGVPTLLPPAEEL